MVAASCRTIRSWLLYGNEEEWQLWSPSPRQEGKIQQREDARLLGNAVRAQLLGERLCDGQWWWQGSGAVSALCVTLRPVCMPHCTGQHPCSSLRIWGIVELLRLGKNSRSSPTVSPSPSCPLNRGHKCHICFLSASTHFLSTSAAKERKPKTLWLILNFLSVNLMRQRGREHQQAPVCFIES